MNTITEEKQEAILQGYEMGLSVRFVADVVGVTPVTARAYLKRRLSKLRNISEGMKLLWQLRRGELSAKTAIKVDQKLPQNLTEIVMLSKPQEPGEFVKCLPCGKTEDSCVDCREIFGNGNCRWGII
jgi:hypothetical protein